MFQKRNLISLKAKNEGGKVPDFANRLEETRRKLKNVLET